MKGGANEENSYMSRSNLKNSQKKLFFFSLSNFDWVIFGNACEIIGKTQQKVVVY